MATQKLRKHQLVKTDKQERQAQKLIIRKARLNKRTLWIIREV